EEECIKQGHTYLPTQNVLEMTQDMLSQSPNEVIELQQLENMIQILVEDTKLVKQEHELAIPSLYYSELKIVQKLYHNYNDTNKYNNIIKHEQLKNMIKILVEDTKLVRKEHELSIPSLYYSELKSVQNLYRNYTYTNKLKEIEQSELLLEIGEIEQRNQVTYA